MAKEVGLLPCSGACNVGMMTTRAVVDVFSEKENTDFVCALGLPLGIDGIIKNGKSSDSYIAVNGCPVKCATKALQSADINVNEEIVLSEEYCIEKNKDLKQKMESNEVVNKLLDLVSELE
ncbi:MAG: putative zinc-binding protein [Halanaerobium sp.]